MARELPYNINRFDGGMTSSPRDVTQRDRFAYLSHFDIYRDTGKMYVMPGYVDDNAYDGSATGLKQFGIRAFGRQNNTTIFGIGTKSDGTGTKLMQRNLSDSEWIVPTNADYAVEGTATLAPRPFLFAANTGDWHYPVQVSSTTYLAEQGGNANAGSGGIDDTFGTLHATSVGTEAYTAEKGFDGKWYISKSGINGVASVDTSGNFTQNAKSTGFGTFDVQSGNYQLGIIGVQSPDSRVLLWDSASLLADESLRIPLTGAVAIGYPSNIWSFVSSEGIGTLPSNGKNRMVVRYAQGEAIETRFYIESDTSTNQVVYSLRGQYGDAMTWYGRIPTNSAGTTFREGVWAFGKGSDVSQMGVSVLLDTSSLGEVISGFWLGNNFYLAHSDDGSVSRLDNFDTGTFDVKATAETVWYGNETPYQKELNGISVVTSPLPSGAQVEMFYRVNDSDSWTSMGTSSTTGKMKHVFTRVAGQAIGKFQEIQFKFEVLGKVAVQNVSINLTETDDLAY